MGFSKIVKWWKRLRHGSSNTSKSHTDNAQSLQTTVPLDNGSSSLSSGIPNSPSSADQQTSQPNSCAHEGTEPPSSKATSLLWTRAYEALRDKEMQLVVQYEKLLSRELDEHATGNVGLQDTPPQEDLDHLENRIDTNHDRRQAQLKAITDQGLRRADEKHANYTIFGHNFAVKDQVAKTAQFIQAIKGLIDEAVKVSPEASLAWAGVCVLLPVLTNPSAAEEANSCGLSYVTSRIRYYVELERLLWPEALCNLDLKTEFDDHIVDLYQHILEFQIKSVLRFYRKWLANLGRDVIRHDDWEGMVSKIKELEQIVREESSTANTIAARRALEAIGEVAEQQYGSMKSMISVAEQQLAEQRRTNRILEDRPIDLPVVNEARYDSVDVQDSPRCENDTRVRILETITQWADEGSGEPLFWLVGPAGTGKSTIARTVADYFAKKKRLVGGYFFKRGEQGRNDTSRLFPTLAMQLAEESPPFRGCLQKSLYGLDGDAVEKKSLKFQFDKVLWQPLADLPPADTSGLPRLFIIDALDECERLEHLSQILALLSKLRDLPSIQLRVLFTSRSAPKIIDAFESLLRDKTARSFELHLEFPEDAKADIRNFLSTRFADIRRKRSVQQNPWPTAEDLDCLVRLATSPEPLFIYAATLCRFVYDERRPSNPKKQLKLWLEQCEDNKSQLHQIYAPILSQILQDNDEAEFYRQLKFLGALILLATPLPAVSLAALLGIDLDDVNWWLQELHAVLNIPSEPHSPIRLLHKSFSDFLLSPGDSNANIYRVDAAETHTLLAAKCIQRMTSGLKQDICGIRKLDATRDDIDKNDISRCISVDLEYACLHWVYHLQGSERSFENDTYTFFYEHFLHWLEVLSLLQRLPDGVTAVRGFLEMIKRFPSTPLEFVDLVEDASRVISSFGSVIDRTPLQTYGTLLFFSPITSKVRQKFWSQRMPRPGRIQGIKPGWDAHLQTLRGHSGCVFAVAFSPDSQLLASASRGQTIILWNATTGTHLQTLEGHGNIVDVVTFSPNSQFLASGSRDKTVRIWGVDGAHQQTLVGHDSSIAAVSFSPDGQFLTSASHDRMVLLWNAKTGVLVKKIINSCESWVRRVALSADSQLIALAVSDNTIQIWNLATSSYKIMLKSHDKSIGAITFSPDNRFVALGLSDHTVRLWSVANGEQKYLLKGHNSWVKAVAFSPDSQLLASASIDRTVRLWNVTTGAHHNILKNHHDSLVNAVAFSGTASF
ncbi:hypothetical protein GGR53DRAFT_509023 [Hypoxylon sp. FL1150]|nr:hypothetical protein GGR53DRAFT_509023 [Hypoxylon sp. FL1150]